MAVAPNPATSTGAWWQNGNHIGDSAEEGQKYQAENDSVSYPRPGRVGRGIHGTIRWPVNRTHLVRFNSNNRKGHRS